MKKFVISIFLSTFLIFSGTALDFSIRIMPSLFIPMQEYMQPAFLGTAQVDVDLFGFLTAGVEGNYVVETPKNVTENISIFSFGAGVGGYYNPIWRLSLGGGAAFGMYQSTTKLTGVETKMNNFYMKFYGDIGLRATPTVAITATGGYVQYFGKKEPFANGPFFGLTAKMNVTLGKKGTGNCTAKVTQDDYIYPLYQQVYRTSPVCSVTVTNGESGEIRNVTVSFRSGKYTASAYKSEKVNSIRKMEKKTFELPIDFSSELLRFSDDGKLSGEIVMDYELLGKKKQSIQNVALNVKSRDSYRWGNEESIAAFISPDTPEILEYAKYVAGVARNNLTLYTGMNRNIHYAAAMMEALKLSGIKYNNDKETPYVEYHKTNKVDFIQYPVQTMNFGSGDYDDIGILLASCLEAVGVPTGFVPLDDDFIVLVSLQVRPNQVLNHFADSDGLIVDDVDVFFPLSMKNFEKGFTVARVEGEKKIKAVKKSDNLLVYVDTEDAWMIYPPAVYTESTSQLQKPQRENIEKSIRAAIADYINNELSVVIERTRKSGNSNKLGMAYVRAGRYAEARAEFQKAAAKGSVSAMNNVANVMMYEKNYAGAAAQYKKILQIDPSNKVAKKGLENANTKLGQ